MNEGLFLIISILITSMGLYNLIKRVSIFKKGKILNGIVVDTVYENPGMEFYERHLKVKVINEADEYTFTTLYEDNMDRYHVGDQIKLISYRVHDEVVTRVLCLYNFVLKYLLYLLIGLPILITIITKLI